MTTNNPRNSTPPPGLTRRGQVSVAGLDRRVGDDQVGVSEIGCSVFAEAIVDVRQIRQLPQRIAQRLLRFAAVMSLRCVIQSEPALF